MNNTHGATQRDPGLLGHLGLTREAVLETMSAGFVRVKTQFGTMIWAKDTIELEELLDSGCTDPIYTLNEILNIALVFKSAPGAVEHFQAIKKVMGSRTMVVPDEPLFVEDCLDKLPTATARPAPHAPSQAPSQAPLQTPGRTIPGAQAAQHETQPETRPETRPKTRSTQPDVVNNDDTRRRAVNCI